MENFKSIQHGWYIWVFSILALIGAGFILFSPTFPAGEKYSVIPILIFSIGLVLCFSKLESTVYKNHISIKFGVGLIRKKIMIADIEEVTYVKNKGWYGWGIRITPHGWLWNIKGKEAVQFKLKGQSRYFRLGCADMKAMHKAIKAQM